MFDDATLRAAARVAKENGWPVHHLLAVAEVESAGHVFATVDDAREPVVRFEGHYFYKRVVPHRRDEAVKLGLARAKAGAVKNPASQQARWDKLIKPAAALDRQAAYESTSWGLGQVMGAHWKALGYSSVLALVDHARRGADGQIELMARFIKANAALSRALANGDWAAFASGYNGRGYKANAYDTKMAAAASRWRGVAIPSDPPVKPADAQEPAKAPETQKPSPSQPTAAPGAEAGVIGKIVALIVAAGLAALGWLAHLPCEITGYFCGGN